MLPLPLLSAVDAETLSRKSGAASIIAITAAIIFRMFIITHLLYLFLFDRFKVVLASTN